jgi:hypothetical protein
MENDKKVFRGTVFITLTQPFLIANELYCTKQRITTVVLFANAEYSSRTQHDITTLRVGETLTLNQRRKVQEGSKTPRWVEAHETGAGVHNAFGTGIVQSRHWYQIRRESPLYLYFGVARKRSRAQNYRGSLLGNVCEHLAE